MSGGYCLALPKCAMGLSAVCGCGIRGKANLGTFRLKPKYARYFPFHKEHRNKNGIVFLYHCSMFLYHCSVFLYHYFVLGQCCSVFFTTVPFFSNETTYRTSKQRRLMRLITFSKKHTSKARQQILVKFHVKHH